MISYLIRRENLPLSLIKEADASAYHHLKLILMSNETKLPLSKEESIEREKSIKKDE